MGVDTASEDLTIYVLSAVPVITNSSFAFTSLFSFTGTNGELPGDVLTQGSDGNFYGTTPYGGDGACGTMFRMAPPYVTGSMGAAFSFQIQATNTPTCYGATGLPTGLNISTATGLISGTATQSGTFNVALSAINASGTGSGILTIVVPANSGVPALPAWATFVLPSVLLLSGISTLKHGSARDG